MKTEMNMVAEVDAFIKVPQGWPIANYALKLLSLKGSIQSSKEVSLLELVQVMKRVVMVYIEDPLQYCLEKTFAKIETTIIYIGEIQGDFKRQGVCALAKNFLLGIRNSDVESDDECNVDGVSETVFSDNVDECNVDGHGKETDKQQSKDPFGFYDLLNKLPAKGVRDASTSLSHPPGFTPKTSVTHANVGEICEDGPTNGEDMVNMPRVDAKVMDHSQEVHDSSNGESVSSFSHKVHNGGSILDILDDMVRVGHSMGYNLDGCLKDMERIIGSQGDEDVLK
ncbi:hypothetical protein Tco_1385045 [Tanacetum coccineum]